MKGSILAKNWWEYCNAIWRYMPGEDKKTIKDIARDIEWLSECGYQAIHITAPYESAGFYPWWGLRPYNYFSVNKDLQGTKEDFADLVRKCHQYDLKVIVFLNLGYADVTSPFWKKACEDKRNGRKSFESRCFCWSNNPKKKIKKKAGTHFLQGGHWHWSEEAGSYYWCNWNEGGYAEPQYNWKNKECYLYIKSILEYWLSTGIDGVIVDAVNWYLNCDMKKIRKYLTNIVHKYPQVFCIPEGGTGFGDDFYPWIEEAWFDIVEDQKFHSDWNGSAIMEALEKHNPDILEQRLQQCYEARKNGIVSWSYLCYTGNWSQEQRLFEIALLIATGHMTEIMPAYLNHFEKCHWDMLKKIMRLTRYYQMAPIYPRVRIFPEESNNCYVLQCGMDKNPVYCVFNLANDSKKISIPVKQKKWFEVMEEKRVQARNKMIEIRVPAGGFRFLAPIRNTSFRRFLDHYLYAIRRMIE